MNINMTDKIEKKESSELTTKSDQLVGVDNIDEYIAKRIPLIALK